MSETLGDSQTTTATDAASSVRLGRWEVAVMLLVSALMCAATGWQWWSIGWTEVGGFITGGVCVWLVVREHLWNWPIGLANNLAFLALFWQGRLYADALLQIVYFALGVYGWWSWLRGGDRRTPLAIVRTTRGELIAVALFLPVATLLFREWLIVAGGASPFWDALTTALSLAAQFLMCRKRLEHWLVWIVADAVYVPLYLSRDLPLTAVLYFVFLLMCVIGWREWRLRTPALAAGVVR